VGTGLLGWVPRNSRCYRSIRVDIRVLALLPETMFGCQNTSVAVGVLAYVPENLHRVAEYYCDYQSTEVSTGTLAWVCGSCC